MKTQDPGRLTSLLKNVANGIPSKTQAFWPPVYSPTSVYHGVSQSSQSLGCAHKLPFPGLSPTNLDLLELGQGVYFNLSCPGDATLITGFIHLCTLAHLGPLPASVRGCLYADCVESCCSQENTTNLKIKKHGSWCLLSHSPAKWPSAK